MNRCLDRWTAPSGESAIFTQFAGEGGAQSDALSRLVRVDLRDGSDEVINARGQVTSAVPTDNGVVAAAGPSVVHVSDSGALDELATTGSTPFKLTPIAGGRVAYMTHTPAGRGRIEQIHANSDGGDAARDVLTTGPLDEIDLVPGAEKTAFVVGRHDRVRDLPGGMKLLSGPRPWLVSARGQVVVRTSPTPQPSRSDRGRVSAVALRDWEHRFVHAVPSAVSKGPERIEGRLVSTGTGMGHRFAVHPRPRTRGAGVSPLIADAIGVDDLTRSGDARQAPAGWVSGTVDSAAACSVPRNSPRTQVYQPNPDQVEWAADMAVKGKLLKRRGPNWQDSGMAHAWRPQGLFKPRRQDGKLVRVPAQILLGILAQESNLSQASWHSLPGIPGNPLVGDFYGSELASDEPGDPFSVDWSESDCGYGISQLTDGMRKKKDARPGETILPKFKQRAVAMDYATNIAAGLRLLQKKWIQSTDAGLVHSDGKSRWIENWFTAVWAYNSGFYPKRKDAKKPWGVGWLNNPINPIYEQNRGFFGDRPEDYADPQNWPYPEKVIGFAANSINLYGEAGFKTAWWIEGSTDPDEHKHDAQPPAAKFCRKSNDCYPGKLFQPNAPGVEGADPTPCGHKDSKGRYDLKCWWHGGYKFNKCSTKYYFCGSEAIRYPAKKYQNREPKATPNNWPNCSVAGLPKNARVVDDLPNVSTPERPYPTRCQDRVVRSAGKFTIKFRDDGSSDPPARSAVPGRIDFHQSGAGFAGHVWWAHTRTENTYGGKMEAKGTWRYAKALHGWARVIVHIPDYAAHTQQAAYKVHTAQGVKTRYALQRTRSNRWVSLGVFKFDGRPKITLSSETYDGTGTDDIAWDATAVQPLKQKPQDFVVALGDSYTSGEGASKSDGSDYYSETNYGGKLADDEGRNACHRSRKSWPRKTRLPGRKQSLGKLADNWSEGIDFQFHACSGAKTHNINPRYTGGGSEPNPLGEAPRGQYGEMSQIDKGYLDKNTTLVMLSIGGNDARFADIITKCITAIARGCPDTKLDGDDEPMKTAVPRLIEGPVRESVEDTLRAIGDRAPNAKILLMGYPQLLKYKGDPGVVEVTEDEADWMNSLTRTTMEKALMAATSNVEDEGLYVGYGSSVPQFWDHWINGDPEGIRNIVWDKVESDKPSLLEPSSQSFHPNSYGTTLYSGAAEFKLAHW